MLFLVISNPYFANFQEIKDAWEEFKSWTKNLKSENKIISTYRIIGKGSVVIFDVSSNDELHNLLTKWLTIVPVPVDFEIYPLVSQSKTDTPIE